MNISHILFKLGARTFTHATLTLLDLGAFELEIKVFSYKVKVGV